MALLSLRLGRWWSYLEEARISCHVAPRLSSGSACWDPSSLTGLVITVLHDSDSQASFTVAQGAVLCGDRYGPYTQVRLWSSEP